MGIQTDVGLVGQQYALLGTILYVGILVGEVSPSALPKIDSTDPRQSHHPTLPHRQIPRLLGDLMGG